MTNGKFVTDFGGASIDLNGDPLPLSSFDIDSFDRDICGDPPVNK